MMMMKKKKLGEWWWGEGENDGNRDEKKVHFVEMGKGNQTSIYEIYN